MAIVAGKWADEWKNTLKQYEKSNESSVKKFKIPGKAKWWQSDKKDSVTKGLMELDAAFAKISKKFSSGKWSREACAAFGTMVKKAEKAGNDYTNSLRKLLDKESKAIWMKKDIGAEYESALKVIKKDIKACVANAISEYMDQKLAADKLAKVDVSEDKQKKVLLAKITSQYKELAVLAAKSKSDPSDFLLKKSAVLKPVIATMEVVAKVGKTPLEISQAKNIGKGLLEVLVRMPDKIKLTPVLADVQNGIDDYPKVFERLKAQKDDKGAEARNFHKELTEAGHAHLAAQAKIEAGMLVVQIKAMSAWVKAALKP